MDRRHRALSSAEDERFGQMATKSANSRVIRKFMRWILSKSDHNEI
jgi:hypothetical protein